MCTKIVVTLFFFALSPAFVWSGDQDFSGQLYRRGSHKEDHYKDAQGAGAVIAENVIEGTVPVLSKDRLMTANRRLVNLQSMSLLREKIKGSWEMTEVDLDYN